MFDTMKFGKALSTLRKEADMTQNEVADRLNLSRQAISKYERGESFPDISVLVMIAELFNVTLDQLINYGEPTKGESKCGKRKCRYYRRKYCGCSKPRAAFEAKHFNKAIAPI